MRAIARSIWSGAISTRRRAAAVCIRRRFGVPDGPGLRRARPTPRAPRSARGGEAGARALEIALVGGELVALALHDLGLRALDEAGVAELLLEPRDLGFEPRHVARVALAEQRRVDLRRDARKPLAQRRDAVCSGLGRSPVPRHRLVARVDEAGEREVPDDLGFELRSAERERILRAETRFGACVAQPF